MQHIYRRLFSKGFYKNYRRVLIPNDIFSRAGEDVNRPFLTSPLGINQVNRHFCDTVPPKKRTFPCLMNFPVIIWPSLINTMKNWIFANFIIRPHIDPNFDTHSFNEGSKRAVEVISAAMGASDFNTLKQLVSEEAYSELHDSVSKMTVAEREQLSVIQEDIYFMFPYQIGLIFEEDSKTKMVEITMCYHILRGLKNMKDSGDDPPITLGLQPEYKEKLYVLNYRFLRTYTKGGEDSGWIVNVVNHSKLEDVSK